MVDFTVKNKDGTVDKDETARLKANAARLKTMVKTNMHGDVRKQRVSEIPGDLIMQGARKLMSVMPGKVGEEGKQQLLMKKIANQIQKKLGNKKNAKPGSSPTPLRNGGIMTKPKNFKGIF
jgi:hypothetical protein|tara:strand:+ start:293 stop:655 length:363 start_codon:yes stop_codon:yes gene_type:complete